MCCKFSLMQAFSFQCNNTQIIQYTQTHSPHKYFIQNRLYDEQCNYVLVSGCFGLLLLLLSSLIFPHFPPCCVVYTQNFCFFFFIIHTPATTHTVKKLYSLDKDMSVMENVKKPNFLAKNVRTKAGQPMANASATLPKDTPPPQKFSLILLLLYTSVSF